MQQLSHKTIFNAILTQHNNGICQASLLIAVKNIRYCKSILNISASKPTKSLLISDSTFIVVRECFVNKLILKDATAS